MRNRWRSNLVAVVCLAALAVAVPAHADDAAAARDKPNPTLADVPASGYVPFTGQPFFLLSDASYGTDQEALVRLEAPGREYKDELARYGGADILVYRVPQPLDFLKAQKNLHRIDVKANYTGEGLANTLAYLWDNWTRQARRALAARAVIRDAQQGGGRRAAVQHGRPDGRTHSFLEQPAVRAAQGL